MQQPGKGGKSAYGAISRCVLTDQRVNVSGGHVAASHANPVADADPVAHANSAGCPSSRSRGYLELSSASRSVGPAHHSRAASPASLPHTNAAAHDHPLCCGLVP